MPEKEQELLDGKYKVLKELGEGGFGKVLLARDVLVANRLVAIKALRDSDETRDGSLLREMKHLAQLNDASVVTFYHHFNHQDRLHLVMEYCSGGSLRNKIQKGLKLDPNTVAQWGMEVADIIHFVHEKGIVHYDIKPDNILLTQQGTLKIGDFGIANRGGGTILYMAPEQLAGFYDQKSDHRFDIYALGITLLELMSGVNVFRGLTQHEIFSKKMKQDFIPDTLPHWVQETLLKATHPTPESRFQTMKDFSESLQSKSVPFLIDATKMKADELAVKSEHHLKRKKWKLASQLFEAALYEYPDSLKALIVAGRYYLQLHKIDEAKKKFDKALYLNPRVDVRKELGWIYLELGSYPLAISMLSDHLHRNPSDYEALNLLIQSYYLTDRYEQAADLSATVLSKNACFYNNLIISRIMIGDIDTVVKSVNMKKEKNPFVRYNVQIATEKNISWDESGKVDLKSKLLFQEYRFGLSRMLKDKNVVRIQYESKVLDMSSKIISIGRLEENDIRIRDDLASRRHCAVLNFQNDVWLYDLNSTTGTYIDGSKLESKMFLLGFYEVRMGVTTFKVSSSLDILL